MKRTILLYSVALASAAFLLQWLEYRYSVYTFPLEIYILVVAVLFAGLGIWVGNRLTRKTAPAMPFERNDRALRSLGVSAREFEVLELLAEGLTNQEVADRLFVSPNTVKTHVASLYGKLGVSRRTQAVKKARSLTLIP